MTIPCGPFTLAAVSRVWQFVALASLVCGCGSDPIVDVPRLPDDGLPLGYEYAATAYDSARERVVLVGGGHDNADRTAFTYYPDTWELVDDVWMAIEQTQLPPRQQHSLAYDARRGRTVLFGGFGPCGVAGTQRCCDETWEWDGATWTNVAVTGPGPRRGATMVYDTANERILMMGGNKCGDTDTRVWAYDGASWAALP